MTDHTKSALREYLARGARNEIGEQDGEVKRVYLFGSLLEGVPHSPSIDIDLALDGGVSSGRV